jgi:hypothetical protein
MVVVLYDFVTKLTFFFAALFSDAKTLWLSMVDRQDDCCELCVNF